MIRYEYQTLPAPRRERRARGKTSGAEAFAQTIQAVLNDQAAAGWEFQRAESLPCDEKKGLFGGRHEVLHALLVFRRVVNTIAPATMSARAEPSAPAPSVAPAPTSLFNIGD
ncbi:MAG: hypothetical protein ACJAVR_000743 [Paracoccaceae bacterium]|jgi:hypothetical protein